MRRSTNGTEMIAVDLLIGWTSLQVIRSQSERT